MKLMTVGLFFVSALMVEGAVYQQPVAVAGKTATMSVEDPHRFPLRCAVVEIDKLKTTPTFGFSRPPSAFVLSAGRHLLRVRYTAGTSMGFIRLWVEAEPDHVYSVKSEYQGNKFTAWIIDSGTNKTVGGIDQ